VPQVKKGDIASRRNSKAQKGFNLPMAVHLEIETVLAGGASVHASRTLALIPLGCLLQRREIKILGVVTLEVE